jgi:hypothetical protein
MNLKTNHILIFITFMILMQTMNYFSNHNYRQTDSYIGYINRNYWGTNFVLFSHGLSEKRCQQIPDNLTVSKQ